MIVTGKELKKALRIADLSQAKAAEMLGVSRQTLNTWLSKAKISPDVLAKVKTVLKIDLDIETSQIANIGDNSPPKPNPRLEAEPLHIASDPNDFDNDGSKFEDLGDGILRMRISIVPVKAYASYTRGYKDPEFYEDLKTESIDVHKEYKGHYLAFEVRGDSMMTFNPELINDIVLPGWLAIGREVPKHHWKYKLHTHNTDAWIIVHETDGILIKSIIKHDTDAGLITVHSLNPKYEDETFSLDNIAQIFSVVKFVVNKR